MADDLLLGIDVGTYETKAVLVTPAGKVVATAVKPHTVIFPRAGWAEHDAEATWWGDVVFVTKALLATEASPPTRSRVLASAPSDRMSCRWTKTSSRCETASSMA